MKKLNRKSKGEQLFIIGILFVLSFTALCSTGCGGSSCETPMCGKEDVGDGTVIGVSVPGCGGCMTPSKGCDSACWPQSCKTVGLSGGGMNFIGCDVRYYGGGCFGCGQEQKSCYSGYISYEEQEQGQEQGQEQEKEHEKAQGFFYGSTDSDEKMMGHINGCGGCVASDGEGAQLIHETECWIGVE